MAKCECHNLLSLSANDLIFGDNNMRNSETAETSTLDTESDLSLRGSSSLDIMKKPPNKEDLPTS